MKFPIKGLGEIGYVPDVGAWELAPNAISELQNFRMRNGWAEKVRGYVQFFADTLDVPYFVWPYATLAARYLVSAGRRGIYVDEGSNRTEITPATALSGQATDRWTGGVLSGILVMNNGVDNPLYWTGDTTTKLANLPGWTATHSARSIRPFKYHLVALNVTKAGVNYAHRLKISAAALPGSAPTSWDETDPTKDTYEVDVVGEGTFVDSLPLGDTLILYKTQSNAALRYTGNAQEIWSVQPLPEPIGMMTAGCGVVVPGIGHVILTTGDVVAYDGNTSRSLIDEKAKKWLIDSMDPDYYAASFVTANYQKSEVLVCFPERGQTTCTKALVWNWKNNTISKRDLPNVTFGCAANVNYAIETYDSDSVTFDSESTLTFNDAAEVFTTNDTRLFMCTVNREIFIMDSSDLADGAAFTGYIERTHLTLDEPERRKHLTRIWIQADGTAGTTISVYAGASNDPVTAPTYQSPSTFTIGTDQWVDVWTEGRELAYKLSSTGWFRVRSVSFDVKPGGMY